MKTRTPVRISGDLLTRAKELGLDVAGILDTALENAIREAERVSKRKTPTNVSVRADLVRNSREASTSPRSGDRTPIATIPVPEISRG